MDANLRDKELHGSDGERDQILSGDLIPIDVVREFYDKEYAIPQTDHNRTQLKMFARVRAQIENEGEKSE